MYLNPKCKICSSLTQIKKSKKIDNILNNFLESVIINWYHFYKYFLINLNIIISKFIKLNKKYIKIYNIIYL
jgi:hypothetical protein